MNGFKLTAAAAAFFTLGGCALTNHENIGEAPAQFYRPAGASDQIKITGQLDGSFNHFDLKRPDPVLSVYIDDQLAIKGPLSYQYTGEVSGKHNGLSVDSVCSSEQKSRDWIEVKCLVLIDNERAATLIF